MFAILLSACSFTEDVAVTSAPEGADVFVNNEKVGQTPAVLDLKKDGIYDIKVVKQGYKDVNVNLAATKKNPFVKFGPLVDMGYYKELGNVDAKMKPDFLPDALGTDVFGDLTKAIAKADQLRKDGKISPEEHSSMIATITEFVSKK